MEMVGAAIDIAMEKAERDFGIKFLTVLKLYPDFCNSVLTSGAVSGKDSISSPYYRYFMTK